MRLMLPCVPFAGAQDGDTSDSGSPRSGAATFPADIWPGKGSRQAHHPRSGLEKARQPREAGVIVQGSTRPRWGVPSVSGEDDAHAHAHADADGEGSRVPIIVLV